MQLSYVSLGQPRFKSQLHLFRGYKKQTSLLNIKIAPLTKAVLFAVSLILISSVTAMFQSHASPVAGLCVDGTPTTPCCGYGSCNMFCANCDGGQLLNPKSRVLSLSTKWFWYLAGCRRENLPGFLAIANGLWIKCRVRDHKSQDYCDQQRADAEFQCTQSYSSSASRSVSEAVDTSSSNSSEIFDFANLDGSGNMTLAEYFTIMGLSTGNSGQEIAHRAIYAQYLFS